MRSEQLSLHHVLLSGAASNCDFLGAFLSSPIALRFLLRRRCCARRSLRQIFALELLFLVSRNTKHVAQVRFDNKRIAQKSFFDLYVGQAASRQFQFSSFTHRESDVSFDMAAEHNRSRGLSQGCDTRLWLGGVHHNKFWL